jgi:GR25 family glycosyltransferase involved in LPS biosynthesis
LAAPQGAAEAAIRKTNEPMPQRIPVYILSLARAAERRKSITAHLDRLGIGYEIVDGVDGQALSEDYVAQVTIPDSGLSRGMIGCNLSHFASYRRLVESGRDAALVLEDDARLHADIRQILEAPLDASRFDICLLDCLNRNNQVPVFYDPDDRLPLGGGYSGYRLSTGPQTLHAYLISRAGAEARIARFFPMREAIDTYTQMIKPLRFYAVVGKRAAWVSEFSLDSMTSKGGRMANSDLLRMFRHYRWFQELVDWVKLTRARHILLARLLKAEYFLDRDRRWRAMPSGRPVIHDETDNLGAAH